MQLRQTTLGLPCDSLADFSTQIGDQAAGNLLAIWTSLWHPTLLSLTGRLPEATSAEALAQTELDAGLLVVLPTVSTSLEVDEWAAREPLALRITEFERRSQVISQLAETLHLELEDEIAGDFYALGFAYLQIELLTRSMRYERDVSQESLRAAVVAAAQAALAADKEKVDQHLADAYDQLMQSRNHYYPIDFYLIDLSLTAPGVAGEALTRECQQAEKGNVLVTGNLLQLMADQFPDSLNALSEGVRDRRICVCGGMQSEGPLADLTAEQLLAEVRGGQATAEQYLGERLRIFAHRQGVLAPLAPGVLYRTGYHAVLVSNFSGAPLPALGGSRTAWSGLDNATLDALSVEPLDMGSHSALLGVWEKMQQAMNYDLAASLLLAGWPGHKTPWHADWLRVANRSTLLGRPVTLDEYFDITSSYDQSGGLTADDYPIATTVNKPQQSAATSLSALAHLAQAGEDSTSGLARLLGSNAESNQAPGTLWLNASPLPLPVAGGAAPAFGWRWCGPRADSAAPPRCEPGKLCNEHMQVVFDPRTGGVSAIRLHDRRGNLLSQQIVIAPLGAKGVAAGLQLAADGWQVAESSDRVGRLKSKFRVLDRDAKTVAEVEQFSSLSQHSKSLEIELVFRPLAQVAANLALASRVAVPQEDFPLTRGLQNVDLPTQRSSVRSQWLGIGSEPNPMAVLCDAPRMHSRHSLRILDSTLVESATEETTVRVAYMIDSRHPAQQFSRWAATDQVAQLPSSPLEQPAGWWLRISAANVMATHLSTEHMGDQLLMRLRLLETAGKPVTTTVATWRPIVDAQQLNFLGEPDQLLAIEQGEMRMSLAPYEFVEVVLLIATDG